LILVVTGIRISRRVYTFVISWSVLFSLRNSGHSLSRRSPITTSTIFAGHTAAAPASSASLTLFQMERAGKGKEAKVAEWRSRIESRYVEW